MQLGQMGFTLIETSATVSILATLAALAMPGFEQLLQRRHVEGTAAELAADLQFLRSEAVARNRPLRASFMALAGGASCYVLHSGRSADCSCTASGACSNDAEVIKTVVLPAQGRAQVQSNVSTIVYDPAYGTSTPAATLRVIGRDGHAIHHVVNIMGRVRSCSPDGAYAGLRRC